eukprot:1827273-Rhodomonas_salina.2
MPPNEQTGGAASPTAVKSCKDLVISAKVDTNPTMRKGSTPGGPIEEKAGQRPEGHVQVEGTDNANSSICIPVTALSSLT